MAESPEPVYMTTDEDFRVFCAHVQEALAKLELSDWDVFLVHKDHPDCSGSAATSYDLTSHCAWIDFFKTWHCEPPGEGELRKMAVHEVVHILIAPVAWCARQREMTKQQLDEAVESVVIRLARFLGPMVFNESTSSYRWAIVSHAASEAPLTSLPEATIVKEGA